MRRFFRLLLIYALSLWINSYFFTGTHYGENPATLLTAGFILTIAALIIKPVLSVITLPFQVVTLGLFGVLLNTVIFYVIVQFVPGFEIGTVSPQLLLKETFSNLKFSFYYPWNYVFLAVLTEMESKIMYFLLGD